MERIVVGYDHSSGARAALRWAIHHGTGRDVELVIVYVMSALAEWELAAVQVDPDPIRQEFERRLREEWTAPVREAGVPYTTNVAVGRPADQLMRVARRDDAALIVIGMTGRGTLAELVFGSTTHDLLRPELRPVVAVPVHWIPPHTT